MSNTTPLYNNPEMPYGFELAVETLMKNDIDTIFCLPGNAIVPMLATAGIKGMKVITCRSEYAAVLAAAGFAMRTGRVGLASVTAGYTAIAAYGLIASTFGQIPVVLLEGATDSRAVGLRTQHELDQQPIAEASYVKASYHCSYTERIPQMLTWAIQKAKTGVPGAVFIDVCQDKMKSQVSAEEVKKFPACLVESVVQADPAGIEKAVELLLTAKKPAIVVGRLGAYANIGEEMTAFVEHTGIPVETGLGYVPDSPLNLSNSGALELADVVLTIGKQSVGMMPEPGCVHINGKIISIYPDASDFGRAFPIEIGLAGDTKPVMKQLLAAAKKVSFPDYSGWVAELTANKAGFNQGMKAIAQKHLNDEGPIHPTVMADAVAQFMMESGIYRDATISVDAGDAMIYNMLYSSVNGFNLQFPQQEVSFMTMQNVFAIGMGLALGVGAGAAYPDNLLFYPVLGDGSCGYNIAELETLARENIPALIVMSNNSCWGMVYNDQRRIWGRENRHAGMLGQKGEPVHYEKVCEGFGGINGGYITKIEDLRPALEAGLKAAVSEKRPVLINVITDPYVYNTQYANWTLPATEAGEPYHGFGEE